MPDEREIGALIESSLSSYSGTETLGPLEDMRYRELQGGLSGSLVLLLDEAIINQPLVLKAGSAAQIESEVVGRRQFAAHDNQARQNLGWLEKIGLDGACEGVKIRIEKGSEIWKTIVYRYFGASSYLELEKHVDFQWVIEDFCGKQTAVGRFQLEGWLTTLVDRLDPGNDNDKQRRRAIDELHRFLPEINWEKGVIPVLKTAAAFAPEGAEELSGLYDWWVERSAKINIAHWPVRSVLHGDLRFANVLIHLESVKSLEIVDFGNVTRGHLLQDIAKFECDLLFRIHPQEPEPMGRSSTEELRSWTLSVAFGEDFKCLHRGENAPDNPQLDALRILRNVYDRKWNFSSVTERHDMYRWFLLAEVLRRLLWFEEEFSGPEGRRALLRSVLLLRRAIDHKPVETTGFTSTAQLVRRLGCSSAYVATGSDAQLVNEDRNRAKIAALRAAAQKRADVRLIAETGHSYLATRRPFYNEIKNVISCGGHVKMVLIKKDFVEAHGVSAAYRERGGLDDVGLHEDFKGKFDESVRGYRRLKKGANSYAGTLEVRITHYGLPATILMAGDVVFFEPYFHSDRARRAELLFDTFELKLENRDTLRLMDENFQFFWDQAEPLEEYLRQEETYRNILRQLDERWRDAE